MARPRSHPNYGGPRTCAAGTDKWRVVTRLGNRSAFNGYRFMPSEYSEVTCLACGNFWRTKAAYVDWLADYKPRKGT